jgi:hypothetical protein
MSCAESDEDAAERADVRSDGGDVRMIADFQERLQHATT